MSLHIYTNHQCSRCGQDYIPFNADVHCPKCGSVGNKWIDFVPQAADSVLYNFRVGKSFLPGAWYVGCLGDQVLQLLFIVLESYHRSPKQKSFAEMVKNTLANIEWQDQLCLRNHILEIAVLVYEEIRHRGIEL